MFDDDKYNAYGQDVSPPSQDEKLWIRDMRIPGWWDEWMPEDFEPDVEAKRAA